MAGNITAPGLSSGHNGNTRVVKFVKAKETKGTIVFQEQLEEGQPDVVGTLYLKRWFAGSTTRITVTITKE